MPPEEYYTKSGRGYPDLAAVSNHYWVVNNMVPVPGFFFQITYIVIQIELIKTES